MTSDVTLNNLKKLAQFEVETAVLKGWQVKHVQELRVACIPLFAKLSYFSWALGK